MSVSLTPNQALLGILLLFSAWPGFGYGTLIQCSQAVFVWGMRHWHYTTAGIFYCFSWSIYSIHGSLLLSWCNIAFASVLQKQCPIEKEDYIVSR